METPQDFFERMLEEAPEDYELRKYKDTICLMMQSYGTSVRVDQTKELTKIIEL